MKKEKIDVDLIDPEPEPVPMKRNILSDHEACLFACTGFFDLKGQRYFKKKRFNTRLVAEKELQPGEVIIETRIAAFIMTQEQTEIKSFQILNYI